MVVRPDQHDGSSIAALDEARERFDAAGVAEDRLEEHLVRLWDEHRACAARTGAATLPFVPSDDALVVAGGCVRVTAIARAGAEGALLAGLQDLGLEGAGTNGVMVGGFLPIASLPDAACLDSLVFLRGAYAAQSSGSVTSEGDTALYAAAARAAFGVDGTGVTVGVLSDSFNTSFDGTYAEDIASGDLPPGIVVLEDFGLTSTIDEGRAMLQIVHDVAPGARLAFATAIKSEVGFAENIVRLATEAAAGVIVDDIIYYDEPMFMDGLVAQAVDEVAAMGVVYLSAAGNQARQSYEAGFRAAAVPTGIAFPFGYLSAHDFDPGAGVDTRQRFELAPGKGVNLILQWADPFATATGLLGADTSLDMFVLDSAGAIVARSTNINRDADPFERLSFNNNSGAIGYYDLVIVKREGPDPSHIKYVDFKDSRFTEHRTDSGASYGHSSARGAIGVGAADAADTPADAAGPDLPVLQEFSSAGGTPILFDRFGNRLAVPEERERVDLVGPDGGRNTFFGTGNRFFGTSAAAPHIAAVVALLLELDPTFTAERIEALLEASAIEMDDPATAGLDQGHDEATGHGFVNAYAALALASGGDVGDDAATAVAAAIGSSRVGVIERQGDRDWFAVSLAAGAAYRFELHGFESGQQIRDPVLELRRADGSLVARDDDGGSGRDAELEVTVTAGGRYFVVASEGSGEATGAYRLLLDGPSASTLVGTAAADILVGGDADEVIAGLGGDDVLRGGAGDDRLAGHDGDDWLEGGAGDDRLNGGPGRDTADYKAAPLGITVDLTLEGPQQTGGSGRDELISISNIEGSAFGDVLGGNALSNVLSGRGRDDVLSGEDGSDTLIGALGDDRLHGGGGSDRLDGGAGGDLLVGGAGNDVLDGGEGDDTLDGGDDRDAASYAGAGGGVTVDLALAAPQATGGAGTDRLLGIEWLEGSSFDDTLSGDLVRNVLSGRGGADTLRGRAGDDTLAGEAGDDVLDGGDGDDTLDGGRGVDRLLGGGGDDHLVGGQGPDTLTGGAGEDFFVIAPGGDTDRITDFTDGQDRLSLAGFGPAYDSPMEILAVARQVGQDVRIRLPDPDGAGVTLVIIEGFALGALDPGDLVAIA